MTEQPQINKDPACGQSSSTDGLGVCACSMAARVLGDGCDVCNPVKALEYAKGNIADLEAVIKELETALSFAKEGLEDLSSQLAHNDDVFATQVIAARAKQCLHLSEVAESLNLPVKIIDWLKWEGGKLSA